MSTQSRTTWEYQLLEPEKLDEIHHYAAKGWELVALPGTQGSRLLLRRPAPTFQEQVTLDQRRRYFGEWGLDPDEDGAS